MSGLNLKPVKVDPGLVELLESNNIASCASLDSATFLIALSSGEVFRTGNSMTRLKFSSSLLSSVLPESVTNSSGHRSTGSGFLSAAVAAVGLGSGGGSTQAFSKIDVSRIFKIDKNSALVTTNNGDNYYTNIDSSVGYLIGGGAGVITAVAPIGASGSCLIGTQTGKIFLLNATALSKKTSVGSLIDNVPLGICKVVYELPGVCRITDMVFSDSYCFVSTATCLYSFSGSKLFASGSAHLVWESPVAFIGSRVCLHAAVPELVTKSSSRFSHVSWLNGSCIITSTISDVLGPGESRQPPEIRPHSTCMGGLSATQSLVSKPREEVLKKIPTLGDFFAVFDYFYIILFESKMIAISRILPASQYVHQISTSGNSSVSYGILHGLHGMMDLVFSPKRLYTVVFSNEKFDAWRFFLRRKNFNAAIAAVVDENPANKALIYKAEADHLFNDPDNRDSASDLYARALLTDPRTISPFVNEIISKLSVNRKSLLKFLLTKLDSIGKDDDDTEEEVIQVQVSVLFIYIASLFVEELACRHDTGEIDSMFIQFVQERFHSLNSECIKAVYELLETSGMFAELIMVAETVGDTDKAIRVDMETGNYLGIIRRLSTLSTSLSVGEEDTLVKIAPVLFRFHPSEFIDLLIKKRKLLLPDRFLTSVIAFAGSLTRNHKEHVVRYLEFRLLEDGNVFRGESLMNVLIELKCGLLSESKPCDETSVMHLLESICNRSDFCSEFCLRVLRHHSLKRSEILLLAINGEYLKATRLALELPDQELAKEVAWRSRSRSTQKVCWMAIIGAIESMEEVVKIFREAEVLDVVDLVTILNNRGVEKIDGVVFQEISEKLKTFDDTEKSLESEIGNYCEALELIRSDLRSSRMNACSILSHSQKCEVCLKLLYNEQFIVFNLCGHCFHTECLKDVMTMRLVNMKSQTDIDEKICQSCVLCGDESMLVETLFSPFVDASLDGDELDYWTIKGI